MPHAPLLLPWLTNKPRDDTRMARSALLSGRRPGQTNCANGTDDFVSFIFPERPVSSQGWCVAASNHGNFSRQYVVISRKRQAKEDNIRAISVLPSAGG